MKRLSTRLVSAFVLVGVLPLLVVAVVSYFRTVQMTAESEYPRLDLLWGIKRQALVSRLHHLRDSLLQLGDSGVFTGALADSSATEVAAGMKAPDISPLDRALGTYARLYPPDRGVEDVLWLDAQSGTVRRSHKMLQDLGQHVESPGLQGTCVHKAWKGVKRLKRPVMMDFSAYAPANAPSAAVGVPVFNKGSTELAGVLVARINAVWMNTVLSDVEKSLGQKTKSYTVGTDFTMRSELPDENEPALLKVSCRTEPVIKALKGHRAHLVAPNYKGQEVVSSAALLRLNTHDNLLADFDWVLVTERDRGDTMSRVTAIFIFVAILGVVVTGASAAVGGLLARGIAKPIGSLSEIAMQAARGDLRVEIPRVRHNDEVKILVESFGTMIDAFRTQIESLRQGLNVVETTASGIADGIVHLCSSAQETSSSVAETTTTVEQLKQGARLAEERAKDVKDISHKAMQASREGKRATDASVDRFQVLKEQMQLVARTVEKLSVHSLSIQQIIDKVEDLAGQSNLLAVNASIEAARAGDRGKGFGVVAYEIKLLADQSRKATIEVGTLIQESQKLVAAVVTATEEVDKGVAACSDQTARAGEAIRLLERTVEIGSEAAGVIGVTGAQQSEATNHVSDAMNSIKAAVTLNMDGTRKIEEAVKRLSELGSELNRMVEQYKT